MRGLAWLRRLHATLLPWLVLCAALAAGFTAWAPAAFGSSLPAAVTEGASSLAFSSATVAGSVNAEGLATTYVFQYGTTTSYGSQTPLAPAGNGTIALKFTAALSGLAPGTTYHYRIVATNADGTAKGQDHSFTTSIIPLSVQVAGVPDPVAFGNPFVVEGNLSGTLAANHEVTLQVNPYPYTAGFKDMGNPELTTSGGGFSFPYIGLLENAQVRVVTVGKPEVASPVVTESVAVRVTLHMRRTRRRGYVYLYGQVAPAEVGALVGFQLMRPGRSINEGGTDVKAAAAGLSRFGRIVRIRHPGVYRALVRIFDGAHASAYSEPVFIR